MTTPPAGNPEVAKIENEIEATIDKVERQEVKVENATTPAEVAKEEKLLKTFQDQFIALNARLDAIDSRLAEPTVPAPEAKGPPATVDSGAETVVVAEVPEDGGKPKKRRLGAWG